MDAWSTSMSRHPRFALTDLPLHVVQRGNDRQPCFFEERDYRVYLRALTEASAQCSVIVHAYVLMTNHVHLLVTPTVVGAVSRLMQSVGSRYVWYVNASRQRSGTLWEGRYKACLVSRDEHVLMACRYIDFNPVRAGMVRHPSDYCWSSYAALTEARIDPLVRPHDALLQLGRPRGPAYARWCADRNCGVQENRLREATGRELAFGSKSFTAEIEMRTHRSLAGRGRGRPPHVPKTAG
jgi:putative transposase